MVKQGKTVMWARFFWCGIDSAARLMVFALILPFGVSWWTWQWHREKIVLGVLGVLLSRVSVATYAFERGSAHDA